jgi:hypothetical protein
MTILEAYRQDRQRVLDRLVDGELGALERRELLAALDDEPGGWRQCGLAFVEAQSWRWQLAQLAAEPIVAELTSPKAPRARAGWWGSFLAVAAGLAMAFTLGTRYSQLSGALGAAATGVGQPLAQVETSLEPAGRVPLEGSTSTAAAGQSPWQTLTLMPIDGAESAEPIELRVVNEAEGAPPATASPAVAAQLVQRLEQRGFEVKTRESLVPIELTDGRRVVVPIEEVDIRSPEVLEF